MLTDKQILEIAENHIIFSRFYEREAIVKIARAIEAACQQSLQDQEWQPIETAPKDGTVFDVYTKYGRVTNCVACKQFGRIYSYNQESDNYDRKVNFATHWMPLPQPPTMQGE